MSNSREIKVLLIEDDPGDAFFLEQLLADSKNVEFAVKSRNTLKAALAALAEDEVDIILLDLALPDSVGLGSLKKIHDAAEDVPVIILTGLEDDKVSIDAVKQGAQDYLPKRELTSTLLVRAIRYALERHSLLLQLKEALANIKVLKGLVPICSKCKKIRNDKGYWEQVEVYIRERSDAEFSHGLCPECAVAIYGERHDE